jgi:drug/metabolite transporter (DMT)-like permease
MTQQIVGQTCAILTALTWAFALIFFKLSGERIPPMALNLFKNVVGLVLLIATVLVLWALGLEEGLVLFEKHPAREIWILLISGFIGIALADTVFFHALNLTGVGIVAIVDCLYSPSIILFSFFMLSERLGRFQWVGAAMILAAVLVSSRLAPPRHRTRGQLIGGVLLGASSMAMMGFGIVLAKPVLNTFPLIWATIIRMVAGTVSLAAVGMFLPEGLSLYSVFRPSRVWKWCIPGSILGAYASLVCWMAGFKYIEASVAGVLNQTSSIFAIVLATVILKESFDRRKLLAVTLALGGVVLVAMNPGSAL